MNVLLGDSERRVHDRCGVVRIDDDCVSPPRMSRGEFSIVTSNLRPGGFRVREEEEIVDRDDLGGGPARNQQWVSRMDDVGLRREALDWWPLAAMPQVIQDADGHSAVDDLRAKFAGQVSARTILPRTGEDHDLVGKSRRLTSECANEVVHVLAYAGPLTKGGSIINEDVHVVSKSVAR